VTNQAGIVLEHRHFDPYGNMTGGAMVQTEYGFTGEPFDAASGLLYLRARHYRPAIGSFVSQDKFETSNRYAYADGNVINKVDPSGQLPLNIWISAFIEPQYITFAHIYDGVLTDPNAQWHGDGRSWYTGGTFPSSRVWFNLEFDTNDKDSLSWSADTGQTTVRYTDLSGTSRIATAKAPGPSNRAVRVSESWRGGFEIDVYGNVTNPLTPWFVSWATYIDFHFSIAVVPCEYFVEVQAFHDLFPWHEMLIQVGSVDVLHIRNSPSGIFRTPLDLSFPAIHPSTYYWEDRRLRYGMMCRARDKFIHNESLGKLTSPLCL
jgi:RHS repeat-associated protein